MKSLRKALRGSRLRTHQLIAAWLRPKTEAVGIRCRLAARIRLANRHAARHPKRTCALVTGSLLFLLIGSIAFDSGNTKVKQASQDPHVESIATMDPVLNGFRAIQANKSQQRQSLLALVEKGQQLRHRLDSLIALPVKSHADSLHLIMDYRQLERIVKSLKNNNNDEN